MKEAEARNKDVINILQDVSEGREVKKVKCHSFV